MRILDFLTGPQGQAAIDTLAKTFNIPPAQVKEALAAIVPEFAHAIERQTLNRGGVADIVSSLGRVNTSRSLDQTAEKASAGANDTGIDVLEQLFGTKDKSRSVAARVARETGISGDIIKQMLPSVAAMTMAALAKGSRSSIQDVIGKVPGLSAASPLGMPGGKGTGGGLPRQTPLPIPGDNLPDIQNPYENLPDVIRRGGTRVPQGGPGADGGGSPASLDGAIRDILGKLLGFQNRGFFGWLFQAIIIPMLLRMVQTMLRRVFTGR